MLNILKNILKNKNCSIKKYALEIKKIVAKNVENFEKWDSYLASHIDAASNIDNISEMESLVIYHQINELLRDIAKNFYEYGRFKDSWDDNRFMSNVYGQFLSLKSLKTEQVFDWGVFQDTFYLETYISHPGNLKYMGDNFWKELLELSEYGDFSFVENAGISSKESRYFNNKKSNLFRLMRNYFLRDIENMYLHKSELDLGWLEIKWEFGTPWETLIENACKAFRIMYGLNYKLWKVTDLKNKRKGL